MLRKLVSNRSYFLNLTVTRRLNVFSTIRSLMEENGSKPDVNHLQAIPAGSSRSWDLDSRGKYVCIGGMRPIDIERKLHVSELIDFQNKECNKLHIEIIQCPTLLTTKLMKSFPKLDLQKDSLRIIKLCYDNYMDSAKGHEDCLIVANYICQKLNDEGNFGFYSGAAIENTNNQLLFNDHKFLKTKNNEIHATASYKNGYIHINNLTANDVGVVYFDCNWNLHELRKWMEDVDNDNNQ